MVDLLKRVQNAFREGFESIRKNGFDNLYSEESSQRWQRGNVYESVAYSTGESICMYFLPIVNVVNYFKNKS